MSTSSTSSVQSSGTSTSQISGIISGLNTTAIISSIMQQAALPQTDLKTQLTLEQAKLAAYQSLNTKMASLQTASDALTSASTWQAMTISSSSSTVSATANAGALAGTFGFDVTGIATGQTSVFANTVSSTSSTVVSGGTPVTLTVGSGSPVTIDTGDGSLGAVIAGINNAKLGVQASAIQVATGQYKLQLASTTTGSSATFSETGLDAMLGAMNNTTNASNAQITVGAGTPGQYTITSGTNTFNNAVPGLTFTVSQLTTGVTLTTTPDSSGISSKVQAMVDAANAVLTEIGNDTAFDTTKNQPSILTGDFTAEQLRDNVLTSISTALGDGTSATSVGLSVTKDGQLAFDSSAFKTAFAASPSTVQSAFGPSIAYAPAKPGLTGSITLQNSTDGTLAGSYDVTVTQAATRAAATIDTSGGLSAGQTITLGSGANAQTYTVTNTDTVQSVTDALNAMSATNNLGVNANLDPNGTTIDLSAAGYGAEYTFTSSATGGLTASAVTAGLDVAGTINGQAAQGIGQLLFTTSNTTGIGAITLDVTLTPSDVTTLAGSAGTFTYQMGAAQKLASVAYAAVATTKGSLTNEITGENSTIADLNTQIASWQVVLDTKQASLEQLWSGLETQLGNLQAQGTALGAAITAMSGGTTSTSSAPKTA